MDYKHQYFRKGIFRSDIHIDFTNEIQTKTIFMACVLQIDPFFRESRKLKNIMEKKVYHYVILREKKEMHQKNVKI